ncbi:hypothetical protein BDFG_08550 [Blastomyces dermatitidis ATCC 26199]|nr:hypothetical protein BDFG_08550 [Blastomyces dermatitidis ATCC 26199]
METISGRRVVAKLPMSVAGLATYVTSSEVATITYLLLYFADTAFVNAGSKQKLENDSTFCVGPHCRRRDLSSYSSALIDAGLARLPPREHPLLHLHKRNIFVSKDNPTAITGFIDWQSTSVEPAFEGKLGVPDVPPQPPRSTQFTKNSWRFMRRCWNFKQDMVETLRVESDGWISVDRWEDIERAHTYFFDTLMASMEDEGPTVSPDHERPC